MYFENKRTTNIKRHLNFFRTTNTTYLAIKAISDNLNEEKNENKWA